MQSMHYGPYKPHVSYIRNTECLNQQDFTCDWQFMVCKVHRPQYGIVVRTNHKFPATENSIVLTWGGGKLGIL